MKNFRRTIILLVVLIYSAKVSGQTGVEQGEKVSAKNLRQLGFIRENDILWRKRVWRIADIADSANAPLRYNSEIVAAENFPVFLLNGIRNGVLKPYADKELTILLSHDKLDSSIQCRQEAPCVYPKQVSFYGIKEDWIFDRNLGHMVVRILGVAPLLFDGSRYTALFWLNYPDSRTYFSQLKVVGPGKKVSELTWDEYFESRSFSSVISRVEKAVMPGEKKKSKVSERNEAGGTRNIWPED